MGHDKVDNLSRLGQVATVFGFSPKMPRKCSNVTVSLHNGNQWRPDRLSTGLADRGPMLRTAETSPHYLNFISFESKIFPATNWPPDSDIWFWNSITCTSNKRTSSGSLINLYFLFLFYSPLRFLGSCCSSSPNTQKYTFPPFPLLLLSSRCSIFITEYTEIVPTVNKVNAKQYKMKFTR